MSVTLHVLRHLGLNLYSSTPAVLSEAVANAWDADAGEVSITWNKNAKTITIVDDGQGMDRAEINERFLKVGWQRRKEESTKTPKKRQVMGRKGIGKLSFFAIADRVEIHTVRVKDGKITDRNALRLSTQDIERAADDEEDVRDYEPKPLSPDLTNDLASGTRIILSDLKRAVTSSTESNLRSRLARRFSVIGPSSGFVVKVDGTEITPADRDYFSKLQFIWSIGAVRTTYSAQASNAIKKINLSGEIDKGKGWRVKGWVGTVDEVKGLDESDNRIVVMARGRLVQEDLLADIKQGGLFTKYLVGEINADFLDVDKLDDIATSDRQRLKETDPRYAALRKWVDEEVLNKVGTAWRDLRNDNAVDDAMTVPAVKEWWGTLTHRDDKAAAKRLFGRIGTVLKERETEKRELYAQTILAFEKLRARRSLTAIESLPDGADISVYQGVFGSQDEIEAALYHEIASGRVAILEKFAGIAESEKERVVQKLLYEHLWLLDPSWERATDTQMEKVVDRDWKKKGAKLTPAQARGRYDIKVLTTAGQHVIIELKKSTARPDFSTLLQQMTKYRETLGQVLATKLNRINPSIRVVGLVGERPDDVNMETQERMLAVINGSVITYDELIGEARERYRDYLDANQTASRLNDILRRVTDQVDSGA